MSEELAGSSFDAFVDDAAVELARLSASQGKSRRVALQDGKVLDLARMSGVEYSFYVEPELFLPDGVDVTWYGDDRRVQGAVVFRNGDYIEIWFDSEIGGDLSNVEVYAGVPDFLDILSTRLQERRGNPSPLALELMEARLSHAKSAVAWPEEPADYASEILKRHLVFVWGPPGTGKTYTLAEVARRLVLAGRRVLMISNTNVAVDQAVIELAKGIDGSGKVVSRFGVPKDKRIVGNDRLSSYEMALAQKHDLRERRDALLDERKRANPVQRRLINEELGNLRNEVRSLERSIVSKADFVATTIAKASMENIIYGNSFDTVLFDEAGMALIPQVAFAACLARNRFVCFGDFRQLPPIVKDAVAPKLATDVYEWVGITDAVDRGMGHRLLVSMETQHRSHPAIADFVGNHLYAGRLRTAESSIPRNRTISLAEPLPGCPMVLVDTTGYPTRSLPEPRETGSYSHHNIFHAFLSVHIAMLARRGCVDRDDDEDSVAIITPYAAQARLIRGILRSIKGEASGIRCSTVHGFQGSSAQVVVFDTVDAFEKRFKIGMPLSSVEHRKADRLVNVALTRARGKVVVLANLESMSRSLRERDDLLLKTLLTKIPARVSGTSVDGTILKKAVGIECLDNSRSMGKLQEDIASARKSILLNVPCMRAGGRAHVTELRNALLKAIGRGIKIVARGDLKLFDGLSIGVLEESEETPYAFHPLCVLDERIVWYGPPLMGGQIKGNTPAKGIACWRIESREVASFIEKRVAARMR